MSSGCQRCGGTMTRDRWEDDGTLCCLMCGWRKYQLAPLPLVNESEGAHTTRALTEESHAVVRLINEGKRVAEVATAMGIGLATARARVAEARQQGLLAAWTPTDKAAIARYAKMHGRPAACQHFKRSMRVVMRALALERSREARSKP